MLHRFYWTHYVASTFSRANAYKLPKISDFGAVDDEGKRSISLWHKQTPGIPGVDFHLERLYNIL